MSVHSILNQPSLSSLGHHHSDLREISFIFRAADHRDRIEGLNEKIRERIIDWAEWVDLYPLFLDEDGSISDQYSNDELHLHGAGYTVWSEAIGDQVRAR